MQTVHERFIVIEGLEGAGKTTAIATITYYLQERMQAVIQTREPGGTALGERLRAIIKEDNDDEPLDSLAELLILYASRVQLLAQVIKPALNAGSWVVADRFELSSFAYQGGGRGIEEGVIQSLSHSCVSDCKPGLTLFLDISPELGFERIKARGHLDRMEQESLEFFQRVYQAYHQSIKKMHHVCVIDASQPMQDVQDSIIKALDDYYIPTLSGC